MRGNLHQCVDVAGRKLRQYEACSLGDDPFHTLLTGNPSPPHVHMVRRAAFARTGLFDVSLRSSEDWDMWIRLVAHARGAACNDVHVGYTLHPDNIHVRDFASLGEMQDLARTHIAGRAERRRAELVGAQ